MKKILTVLTIVMMTGTFATGAFAAPPKQNNGKGLKQDAPRGCMNLTDEQQKQLTKLHQKFIDDTYEMRSEIMTLDQQIRMYMETSHPDSAKLKSMVIEKADLEKDLAVKRMEFALDARRISPELLKYIPMGKGLGFCGPGMGNIPGHQNLDRGAGFNGGSGQSVDCPRMTDDNQTPRD
ncbi:periplasmic heavy metal sensor [uncultured Desulfobacter sp.]|uniref:Spy/CpxP family protein refolding chaperone n=1 Tax=uncultured Desulfobacter sp. TaxID=240139 RepID=UPI002AAA90EC|nr:periplasmic heavy metal sensor [uncultured Desulfobacter sp.]